MSLLADVAVGMVGGTGQGLVSVGKMNWQKERDAAEAKRLQDLEQMRHKNSMEVQGAADTQANLRTKAKLDFEKEENRLGREASSADNKERIKATLEAARISAGSKEHNLVKEYLKSIDDAEKNVTELIKTRSGLLEQAQANPEAYAAEVKAIEQEILKGKQRIQSLNDLAMDTLKGEEGYSERRRTETAAERLKEEEEANKKDVLQLDPEDPLILELKRDIEKGVPRSGNKKKLEDLIKKHRPELLAEKNPSPTALKRGSKGWGDWKDESGAIQLLSPLDWSDTPTDEQIRQKRIKQGLITP